MTRKARAWTGATLLIVIALNYAMIGSPLLKKRASVEKRAKAMLFTKNADDEFVIEVLKKERGAIAKKIQVLNSIAVSLAILIASWTVFGMVFHKKNKDRP